MLIWSGRPAYWAIRFRAQDRQRGAWCDDQRTCEMEMLPKPDATSRSRDSAIPGKVPPGGLPMTSRLPGTIQVRNAVAKIHDTPVQNLVCRHSTQTRRAPGQEPTVCEDLLLRLRSALLMLGRVSMCYAHARVRPEYCSFLLPCLCTRTAGYSIP